MEGMSGLELAQMIRTDPQTPNPFVPVIMLTGHTHIDRVRQARDAGINEFIAKPVSVKTMMSRLLSVIENPAPLCAHQESISVPAAGAAALLEYRGPERRAEKWRLRLRNRSKAWHANNRSNCSCRPIC